MTGQNVIKTLLVANRGEIAVRVIRASQALGIRAVQVYSLADADSLAVKLADESIEIGPPAAAKSHLNMDAILSASKQCNADAVHPGYGFLAENADFADAVVRAGMRWVGPSSRVIRMLGDKVTARKVAKAAGVPTIPGSDEPVSDMDSARSIIKKTGFPVMIKASAGGGGRGIRIAGSMEEFERFFPQARLEARSAFGNDSLYLEKVIERARHVEVQILGDGKNIVHCYERECSLQRRRQKVWEEAPAITLSEKVREKLCNSAVDLAESVNYRGAGTVEYLYDESAREFYFLEVNTRIQVEHPITEMITGVDLVQEMINIAGGEPLLIQQKDLAIKGHAIECRINAEDPTNNFLPFPGTISELAVPDDTGVRFDTLLYPGYTIPPFYDSLIGKLVVHAKNRESALNKLRRTLNKLIINGIKTTVPLHASLANDSAVRNAAFDTRFLEPWLRRHASNL